MLFAATLARARNFVLQQLQITYLLVARVTSWESFQLSMVVKRKQSIYNSMSSVAQSDGTKRSERASFVDFNYRLHLQRRELRVDNLGKQKNL